MTRMNTRRMTTKAYRGCGGLHCGCCRQKRLSVQEAKSLHNRLVRRRLNAELRREVSQ
jgi:hypothetical protein